MVEVIGAINRPFALGRAPALKSEPVVAVSVEVSVLELDSRAILALSDEADLNLAGPLEISLELPPRADVPTDDEPVRWFVREHPRPAALAAVDPPVVQIAADAPLEHSLRDLDAQQFVLPGLDAIELLGEDLERDLDRRLNNDRTAHRR
jgi:hypothetical protein